jgi:enamine deaminase RidA (YjgF/YER057c/UK114 family)
MKVAHFNADAAPQPAGGYTQVTSVSNATRLVFVSGQIPLNEQGEVPRTFHEQGRQVWRNLIAQLGAADMTVADLVKLTTFLSSRDYALANREIRQEFLGTHKCASTVIIAGIFDERWLLEIEAIAAQ